nr:hypothetical protein [uncultured Lachnoclostridium sp.]
MNNKIKKIIRYRHGNNSFYKIDHCLKISRIKIKEIINQKKIDGGTEYLIEYDYGLNLINPLSWVFIVIAILGGIIEVGKEIIDDLKMTTYKEQIRIKDKE